MRIIKMLAEDIEENVREARAHIECAYRLRSEHPQEAAWLRDMAATHLSFNSKGHDLVKQNIDQYRMSDEHKQHPEYVDGMQAVWDDRHADIVAETARVKAMIDTFK